MDSDIKILKLLIGNKEERFTIKKIAEALKINYRTAYETVMKLEKEGLISITKAGNSKICKFADKFDSKVFEAEYERKKDLFLNKDFLILRNRLAELKFPFIALLFGSHAKRTAKKGSDLDILAISEKERAQEIESAISLLPLKIHLTAVTPKEFLQMSKSKEFSVVSEAIKRNIILVGIEDYYRLIENAGR